MKSRTIFTTAIESVFASRKFITQNRSKMKFKKLAGDLLVVAGGVALYMLAVKPLLDKAKITS